MIRLAKSVYMIALSFWVGSIFFLSTVVARTVFETLPRQEAGNLIAAVFDSYYPLQYICAVILIIAGLYMSFRDETFYKSRWFLRTVIVIAMLIITLFAGIYIRHDAVTAKNIMNSANTDTQLYADAENKFRSYHRDSVVANGLVFLLGIVMLIHVSNKD